MCLGKEEGERHEHAPEWGGKEREQERAPGKEGGGESPQRA